MGDIIDRVEVQEELEIIVRDLLESVEKLGHRWTKAESRRLRKKLTEIKKRAPELKRKLIEADGLE